MYRTTDLVYPVFSNARYKDGYTNICTAFIGNTLSLLSIRIEV